LVLTLLIAMTGGVRLVFCIINSTHDQRIQRRFVPDRRLS
jgi:hypothetical protein